MSDTPIKFSSSQKMYLDLSGRNGLAPRWYGDEGDTIMQYPQYRSINAANTKDQMAAGIYNPERRYGFMTPSSASFTTVTENDGSFNFLNEWRATIYDSAGHAWFAENGYFIWRENSGFTQLQTGNSVQSLVAITTAKVTDLEIYQINGVRNIFYSYQNSAGGAKGDIGNIVSPDSGGDVNWFTATATGGSAGLGISNDHFMVVADNGFMYVGDGNYIHKVDGTTLTGGTHGTITPQVLVTSASYVFTDGCDFKGATWFSVVDNPLTNGNSASFSGNTCGIYIWDRQTTVANVEDFIPIKGVRDIKKIYVTQAGKVRILCMSAKRTTQIREYNGAVFETIQEAHLVSYPTYRDSLSIAGNVVYWLGGDGRTYSHGYLVPGMPEQLYIVGDMTGVPQTSFAAGATLYIDANTNLTITRTALMFSISDSTPAIYNRIWYPNLLGGLPSTSKVYTLVNYFPFPCKINYVRAYHNSGNTSGTTVQGTLGILLNQSTTANVSSLITRDDINKGWKYIPVNQGAKNAVVAIQATISFAAVLTSDTNDWMPRMLEVDYSPLEKLQ